MKKRRRRKGPPALPGGVQASIAAGTAHRKATEIEGRQAEEYVSYACSWEAYINGNVVSESSQRIIMHFLMATAASRAEQPGDSSDDSEDDTWANVNARAGM